MNLSDEYALATTILRDTIVQPPRNRNRDGKRVMEIILHSILVRSGAIYPNFFVATSGLIKHSTGISRMKHLEMNKILCKKITTRYSSTKENVGSYYRGTHGRTLTRSISISAVVV